MDGTAATLEARRLIQSLEENPPEPIQEACAKFALRHILNSLRLVGVFFQHDHYEVIRNPRPALTEVEYLSADSLKHLVDTENEQFGSSDKSTGSTTDFKS
ncbi:hypothetical protein EGW08_011257, partial [Elysia chlorotica]